MTRRVSVLLLTYNSARHLPAVLEGLKRQSYSNVQVVILDNASQDASVEIAESHGFTVMRNARNVGYAAGMNQLLAYATGDIVIPLNADCILGRDFVKYVVEAVEATGADVIATFVLKHPPIGESHPDDLNARSAFSAIGQLEVDASVSRISREMRTIKSRPAQASLLTGVKAPGPCPVLTRQVLDALAGAYGQRLFDPTFVTYGEDIDLALRLMAIDATTYYEPRAVALHARSASSGEQRRGYRKTGQVLTYIISARYLNVLRHLPSRHLPAAFGRLVAEDVLLALVTAPRRLGVITDIARAWRRMLAHGPAAIRFRRAYRTSDRVGRHLVKPKLRRQPDVMPASLLADHLPDISSQWSAWGA